MSPEYKGTPADSLLRPGPRNAVLGLGARLPSISRAHERNSRSVSMTAPGIAHIPRPALSAAWAQENRELILTVATLTLAYVTWRLVRLERQRRRDERREL